MSQSKITRRSAMQAGAGALVAIPAALAAGAAHGGSSALQPYGGQSASLADLIRLWNEQVYAFNNRPDDVAPADEEANALSEATYSATERRMIGIPARTADDALAAIDWVERLSEDCDPYHEIQVGSWSGKVAGSLKKAVRDYIASTA